MATQLTPIKVVPHFMRLHEWIALEGGYYRDEGLEPVLMADVMHSVSGPGRRLVALMDGDVDAATLLDPEIPIAEEKGLRRLAHGEFRTLFWVSASIDPETRPLLPGAETSRHGPARLARAVRAPVAA
jgi:hypothetical protein